MNENWEDPIDLEPFSKKEPPFYLPCEHQFKEKTLLDLKEKVCPFCRAPFKMEEIIKNESFLKGLKIRLAILGDSGVGKTCLMQRFYDKSYNSKTLTTVGTDFRIVPIEQDGQKHEIIIQDTSGQERYRSMTAQFYRNQDAFILAYDCDDIKSFDSLQGWLDDLRAHANIPNYTIAITGTKADQDNDYIDKVRIQEFFDKNNLPRVIFEKTSAKTGASVDALFQKIIQERIKIQSTSSFLARDPREMSQSMRIKKSQKKKKNCWESFKEKIKNIFK